MAADPQFIALATGTDSSSPMPLLPSTGDDSPDLSFVKVNATAAEPDTASDKETSPSPFSPFLLSMEEDEDKTASVNDQADALDNDDDPQNQNTGSRTVIVIHNSDSESEDESTSNDPIVIHDSDSEFEDDSATHIGSSAHTVTHPSPANNAATTAVNNPPTSNANNGISQNPSPHATAVAAHVHVLTGAPMPMAGALLPNFVVFAGPWLVGNAYGVVPGGPLAPNPAIMSEHWYTVWKGRWVGVLALPPLAQAAVTGVSRSGCKAFKSQVEALDLFNQTLMLGLVEIA